MLTPLTAFAQLTATDLQSRKRRLVMAAVLYGIGGICLLFALGFGATALTLAIAQTYDLLIALVITASLFLALAAIALIINAVLQARAKRRIRRNSAVRSAAIATALVSLRRSGTAALPLAALVGGAFLARQIFGEGDDEVDGED